MLNLGPMDTLVRQHAKQRGIKVQEMMRVIIPDWLEPIRRQKAKQRRFIRNARKR
jgi:hypothetical protein